MCKNCFYLLEETVRMIVQCKLSLDILYIACANAFYLILYYQVNSLSILLFSKKKNQYQYSHLYPEISNVKFGYAIFLLFHQQVLCAMIIVFHKSKNIKKKQVIKHTSALKPYGSSLSERPTWQILLIRVRVPRRYLHLMASINNKQPLLRRRNFVHSQVLSFKLENFRVSQKKYLLSILSL